MRAVYSCSPVQAITQSSLPHHDLAHFVVEKPEQFSELVNTELALMSIPEVADLTANVATDMLSHFNELHAQYLALGEGATMGLEF